MEKTILGSERKQAAVNLMAAFIKTEQGDTAFNRFIDAVTYPERGLHLIAHGVQTTREIFQALSAFSAGRTSESFNDVCSLLTAALEEQNGPLELFCEVMLAASSESVYEKR